MYHRPPNKVPNLNCCTCDFTSLSNKLEKQESNFALTWQVGAKGLVGHLSNPLYCKWILEMYHIRGQNSHDKKLVWNERIKEGSKNAPKANLTPRWPGAYVIFENVSKEGTGVYCRAIDLNFWLTKSWGESKSDSKGEVACPSSSGRSLKKNKKIN